MQFTSKLTKEDYNEFQKMSGANSNLVMMVFYPIGMLLATLRLWRLTLVFLARTPSDLPYFVLGWIAAAGFVAWTWFYRVQQRAKRLEQINATRPETITLTELGLSCNGPAGAMSLVPWQQFSSWREGKRVVLLKFGGTRGYAILPMSQISDREPIRQFLRSHIVQPGR
jgi:hypothetical protein